MQKTYEMLDEEPLMAVELCRSIEKNLASKNWDGVISDCHSMIKNEAVFQELPLADQAITYLNLAVAHLNKEKDSDAKFCLEIAMKHEGFKKLSHEDQLEAHAMYLEASCNAGDFDDVLAWTKAHNHTHEEKVNSENEATINICIALALMQKGDFEHANHYCEAIINSKSCFNKLDTETQNEILDIKKSAMREIGNLKQ